jgi:uncharacterized membrane protein YoaT (DUF817 family)
VSRLRHAALQLARFGGQEAMACLFPALIFLGLAVTQYVTLPIPRYDALLAYAITITLVFWAIGLETWREVLVIAGFHLVGLALELFKVHTGSWVYPGEAWTKVAGVPLFAGFMYASVGSYICQAWRRLDLRVSGYRPLPTTLVAVAIYANFFTHHWLPDVRGLLAVLLMVVLGGCRVHFAVGGRPYRMPLALAFLLIGTFLWLAENGATFLDAWSYPDQLEFWRAVHVDKLGAWALLVSMSFVLVTTVKAQEGVLYHVDHETDRAPDVLRPGRSSDHTAGRPRR